MLPCRLRVDYYSWEPDIFLPCNEMNFPSQNCTQDMSYSRKFGGLNWWWDVGLGVWHEDKSQSSGWRFEDEPKSERVISLDVWYLESEFDDAEQTPKANPANERGHRQTMRPAMTLMTLRTALQWPTKNLKWLLTNTCVGVRQPFHVSL